MSMADAPQQMKPQDTLVFGLGEIKGEVKALRETVGSAQTSQMKQNATHDTEHAEFRKALGDLTTAVAVMRAQQTPKTPWYSVVAGISGIAALAVAIVALLNVVNP